MHPTPATEVVSGWRSEDSPFKPLTALYATVTHSFDWSPTPGSTTAFCHCRPVLLYSDGSDWSPQSLELVLPHDLPDSECRGCSPLLQLNTKYARFPQFPNGIYEQPWPSFISLSFLQGDTLIYCSTLVFLILNYILIVHPSSIIIASGRQHGPREL